MDIRGRMRQRELILDVGMHLLMEGTLEWEKYKRFEGMSNEDIKRIDMKKFEVYESNRMEKNAWALAEELQNL